MVAKKDKALLAVVVAAAVGAAVPFTGPFEGKLNVPYVENIAGGKNTTVCGGHLIVKGEVAKTYYTDAECDLLLRKDLAKAIQFVADNTEVILDHDIYVAVGDFAFNAGNHNYYTSSIRSQFNAGNFTEGCNRILRYKLVNGTDCFLEKNRKICGGIKTRREAEHSLCLKGAANMLKQNKKEGGFIGWLRSVFAGGK